MRYLWIALLTLLNVAYASDINSIDFKVQNGTLNVTCGDHYQVIKS
ncbi:hypothetical protein [Cysteiniphilum sp. JM-1]|nr:hypothetical protein [Cysteiniphilum sp. JM-1]